MNLKPFRDYSEHEVINLFAAQEGVLNKGTFVQAVSFDPDNHSSYGAVMADLPLHAHTSDYVVNARCAAASANTGVLGITLFDVRTNLPYLNIPANLSDPVRLAEQQVVPSGRALPICKRGLFEVQGFTGVPFPGAAAVIVTGLGLSGGTVGVAAAGTTPNVGMWLSQSGADGGALLQVNCAR